MSLTILPAGTIGPQGDPGVGFTSPPRFVDFESGEFSKVITFDTPEPDTDYLPVILGAGAQSGSPTPVTPWWYDKTTDGFTLEITGDPGDGNTVRVVYALSRIIGGTNQVGPGTVGTLAKFTGPNAVGDAAGLTNPSVGVLAGLDDLAGDGIDLELRAGDGDTHGGVGGDLVIRAGSGDTRGILRIQTPLGFDAVTMGNNGTWAVVNDETIGGALAVAVSVSTPLLILTGTSTEIILVTDEFIAPMDPIVADDEISGTLSHQPVVPGSVTFQDHGNGASQHVTDDGAGNLVGDVGGGGTKTIDYVTGAYSFSFAASGNDGPVGAGYQYSIDVAIATDLVTGPVAGALAGFTSLGSAERAAPPISASGTWVLYMDSTQHIVKISQNASGFFNIGTFLTSVTTPIAADDVFAVSSLVTLFDGADPTQAYKAGTVSAGSDITSSQDFVQILGLVMHASHGGSGTVIELTAADPGVSVNGGTITRAQAVAVGIAISGGAVDTLSGVRVFQAASSGGVATNLVGVMIEDQSGIGGTVSANLWSQGAGSINIFEGQVKANTLNISGIPTSSAGLVSGDVWSDGGVLTIVP